MNLKFYLFFIWTNNFFIFFINLKTKIAISTTPSKSDLHHYLKQINHRSKYGSYLTYVFFKQLIKHWS